MWWISYTFRHEFDFAGCSVDIWRASDGATKSLVQAAHTSGFKAPPPIAVTISAAEADAIHARILEVRINIVPACCDRLGGTWHELEFSAGAFNGAVFRWWCELPEEWTAFSPVVDSLAAIIETSIGAKPKVPANRRRGV